MFVIKAIGINAFAPNRSPTNFVFDDAEIDQINNQPGSLGFRLDSWSTGKLSSARRWASTEDIRKTFDRRRHKFTTPVSNYEVVSVTTGIVYSLDDVINGVF